jgi:GGDEF domain-containing protein
MQDTLSEGTARATQLAPSGFSGHRLPAQSEDLPPEVWLPTLSDDELLLYSARSRVLLDEPLLDIRQQPPPLFLPRRLQQPFVTLVLLAEMFTTLPALFEKLDALELGLETRKAHTSALGAIVHEVKLNSEQLKAVGNDPFKLTMQYQGGWDENRAKLVGLPHKAVELAAKHGLKDLLAMHYCDKLTLLYSKEHYSRLLDLLVGTPGCAVFWASADMDYFKLINDGWSHAHGDFAIIQTGLAIGEVVEEWNRQHKGVARCVPFRMGGDEVRSPPHSALANARLSHARCAQGVRSHFARSLSLRCSCQRARWARSVAR